jgi:hypothetical protein
MTNILTDIVETARKKGFWQIVIPLELGDGYHEMLNAAEAVAASGKIKIENRSGMALRVEIVNPAKDYERNESRSVVVISHLLENEEDDFDAEEAKEVMLSPEHVEYSLAEIKAAEPAFFDRKTMRFHGTRKVYKYKGNYIVLHNVKRMGGHAFGAGDWTLDDHVVYQFVKTKDSPDGVLLYKGSSRFLDTAKRMIKTGDFVHPLERLMGRPLPEAEEEDDFEAKDAWLTPDDPKAVNLSDDVWSDDRLLHRAFTWLTRNVGGPKFGSMSIAYYQQEQCELLDQIKKLAASKKVDLKSVRRKGSFIQAWDGLKWVHFASYFDYELLPS